MPENTATPLGDPNAGENTPNLNVVPPDDSTPQARGEFNKVIAAELSKASSVFAAAQKPEYATRLAGARLAADYVQGLVNLVLECARKAQGAVNCDKLSKQATQDQTTAQRELMESLRTIQGAARQTHLPEQPALLEGYLEGQRLDATRPLLETNSQALIDKANAERPGLVNTEFVSAAQTQRKNFLSEKSEQGSEDGKAEQLRQERDALLEKVIAGRKKIQYAADTLWPPGKPENVQARKDFKLPADRRYTY